LLARQTMHRHRGAMTDEPTEPELTEDEVLMLEVGWLDLWHATREGQTGSTEAG